jgi:DNA-binding NarL/FixJ family response regulator
MYLMDYLVKLRDSAKRNRAMARLLARGWSKAAIARHFGVSRQRVHQVLSK